MCDCGYTRGCLAYTFRSKTRQFRDIQYVMQIPVSHCLRPTLTRSGVPVCPNEFVAVLLHKRWQVVRRSNLDCLVTNYAGRFV